MPQHSEPVLAPETFLDRLLADLNVAGDILIVTHDNPDPDSLASAFGLRLLFERELNRQTTIAYGGLIGRAENRALVRACEIPVIPLDEVDWQAFSTIALVDSQPETGNNSLPQEVGLDLVVDHHPLRDQTSVRSRWVDVREDFGASATIVAKYLCSKKIHVPRLLATALFYAIKSETQDLGVEANQVDREIYFQLFPKVDPRVLYEVTHPRVEPEYFKILGDLTRKTQVYERAAFAYIGQLSNADFVAEMADMLMRLQGIEWTLCVGAYDGDLILSLRTSHDGGGAGQMIQRIVRGLGTAGGHGMMAGGKVRQIPEEREARLKFIDSVRDRFLNELGLRSATPHNIFDE